MSQSIIDFNGDELYLDTMIPYALLRGVEPAAQDLFRRFEEGAVMAYTSVLTFDELSYRLLLAVFRDRYSGSPLDRLRNDEVAMIQQFYPSISVQLMQLRTFPNLSLVSLTADDVERMDEAMHRYHIRPRDALHLAAMQKVGCLSLVSTDGDWDRVPIVARYTLL